MGRTEEGNLKSDNRLRIFLYTAVSLVLNSCACSFSYKVGQHQEQDRTGWGRGGWGTAFCLSTFPRQPDVTFGGSGGLFTI